MKNQTLRVVIAGGGTGMPLVVRALLAAIDILSKQSDRTVDLFVDVVCSPCDNGFGTGEIRDAWQIGPVADVWRNILALYEGEDRDEMVRQWSRRIPNARQHGQSVGNLVLGGEINLNDGDMRQTIRALEGALNIERGRVHLASWDHDIHLSAVLTDGNIINGETSIDIRQDHIGVPIKDVFLTPKSPKAAPEVLEAIDRADLIIWPCGDVYSSITPVWKVPGLVAKLERNRLAKTVVVTDLMTKADETTGWQQSDFVEHAEKTMRRRANFVLVSTGVESLQSGLLQKYRNQGAEPVMGLEDLRICHGGRAIISSSLHEECKGLLRHNPEALAKIFCPIMLKLVGQ